VDAAENAVKVLILTDTVAPDPEPIVVVMISPACNALINTGVVDAKPYG
jgi:hypothetical protein